MYTVCLYGSKLEILMHKFLIAVKNIYLEKIDLKLIYYSTSFYLFQKIIF